MTKTTKTVTIRDLTSNGDHTLPATTRCRDQYGSVVTLAALAVGERADVESDDREDPADPDSPVIWWSSVRTG